ncbi:MAG: mitochondrial fission ELM1 family protein [Azospirillaceae bacterium]|nr:mitochondrial fission ELM1 family protein [Azospirillaceae bacterium]
MAFPLTCWTVTNGAAGMENQCIGMAEAIGLSPTVKRISLKTPWRQLIPQLRIGLRFAFDRDSDPISPPWPDLVIGCGRHSLAALLRIRQATRGRTFTVYIQNPHLRADLFDLIIAPRHDRISGPNVVVTRGAVHRVTPQQLTAASAQFGPRLAWLPRPRVAVLIGGTNGVYRITPEITARLGDRLAALCHDHGAGLMVTPSRRTGKDNEAILRQRLSGLPAEIWDGSGDNPYFGYLGLADAIVVTGDSVSMVSEACSTGKPVYVIDLEGGSRKFNDFHRLMRDDDLVRPFTGTLEAWKGQRLDDNSLAATELHRRLVERGLMPRGALPHHEG